MIATGTVRARIVVAIFTVAMVYASSCSTACAMGFCPNQPEHSESHDCEQSSPRQSNGSQHDAPGSPDCSKHHHPTINFLKANGLPQFPLNNAGHVNVDQSLGNVPQASALSFATIWANDLAPPPTLKIPLYQQTSILRI